MVAASGTGFISTSIDNIPSEFLLRNQISPLGLSSKNLIGETLSLKKKNRFLLILL
jgi:hypothetical protein